MQCCHCISRERCSAQWAGDGVECRRQWRLMGPIDARRGLGASWWRVLRIGTPNLAPRLQKALDDSRSDVDQRGVLGHVWKVRV